MSKSADKKAIQLGEPIGTAANKLRKMIMFALLKETNKNVCFQCKKEIELVEHLSVEHKVPWLDSNEPKTFYYALDNIAFSHISCNCGAARKYNKYPDDVSRREAYLETHRRASKKYCTPEKRREKYLKHGY